MHFTNRERKIISALLSNREGVNISFLEKHVNVSKRTLYRDLNSIKETLKKTEEFMLEKEANHYKLIGNLEDIRAINDNPGKLKELELSVQDRQYYLLIDLLLTEDIWKLESFSYKYVVSSATIQKDLQQIEQLLPSQVVLKKEKGFGSYICTSESDRRLTLMKLALKQTNDYQFFELAKGNNFQVVRNLQFIDKNLLKEVYTFWQIHLKEVFSISNDVHLKQLLLLLTITIQRSRKGCWINNEFNSVPKTEQTNDIKIFASIYEVMIKEWSLNHSDNEKNWLIYQLIYFFPQKKNENVTFDCFYLERGYQIVDFVKYMSEDLAVNFELDSVLLNNLTNHIFQVMSTTENNPYFPIGLSYEKLIKQKYTDIYLATKRGLTIHFPDLLFNEMNIMCIVLYFSTFFEKERNTSTISILVICSYGFGLAEILKNRIERYFPEVSFVKTLNLSELETVDTEQYDLILSTNILKGFQSPYIIVSPFLLDDDIKELSLKIKKSTKNKQVIFSDEEVTHNNDYEKFSTISKIVKLAEEIMNHFEIKEIENTGGIEVTLKEICKEVYKEEPDLAKTITNQLINRVYASPLGFPETNLGLFHCLNDGVESITFKILQLSKPIEIIGFDEEVLSLKRVILIVGNSKNSEVLQMLSKVSITIAESTESLQIFNFGDEKEISNYLKKSFINKVIKEI